MGNPLEPRITRLEQAVTRRMPRCTEKTFTAEQWAEFHVLFEEVMKSYEPGDWTFLEKYRKTPTQA